MPQTIKIGANTLMYTLDTLGDLMGFADPDYMAEFMSESEGAHIRQMEQIANGDFGAIESNSSLSPSRNTPFTDWVYANAPETFEGPVATRLRSAAGKLVGGMRDALRAFDDNRYARLPPEWDAAAEDFSAAEDEMLEQLGDLLRRQFGMAPRNFRYRGFPVDNLHGFSEHDLKPVLDGIDRVLALFRKRRVSGMLADTVRKIQVRRDLPPAGTVRSPAGTYDPGDRTVRLALEELGSSGRLLDNWVEEILIHLGHHVHLSLLPPEAKQFWDSGWEWKGDARGASASAESLFRKLGDEYGFDLERMWESESELQPAMAHWLERAFSKLDRVSVQVTPGEPLRIPGRSEFVLEIARMIASGHSREDIVRWRWDARSTDRRSGLRHLFGGDIPDDWEERMTPEMWDSAFEDGLQVFVDELRKHYTDPRVRRRPGDVEDLEIPSWYGKTNRREDFAETFVLWMTDPRSLSDTARYRMARTLWLAGWAGRPVMEEARRRLVDVRRRVRRLAEATSPASCGGRIIGVGGHHGH